MKTTDEYSQSWNSVPNATHLIVVDDQGATMLCDAHTQAMRLTCRAANIPVEIYEMPPDEEPAVCQACHLVEVNRPKIILH